MEQGGGRRNRKAPIPLDWDKLLGNDNDEEPPQLSVISAAAMNGEDESSSADHCLQLMSDKDLHDSVARIRSGLVNMVNRLPDGGEKLRARLKCCEAELERRKLPKNDDKCKKAVPPPDELTCIGASDVSLPETPSVPPSQSAFASHLCSKLDNETGRGGENKSFDDEISTINCCKNKKVRVNEQFLSREMQTKNLHSRQAPFKSPTHLSINNSNHSPSKGTRSGRNSSIHSPHHTEKDISGYFEKKENASCFQSSHVSRSNKRKTFVLVDEEELEDDRTEQEEEVDERMEGARIYYPSRDDPEALEICYSDLECLTPGSYLSSTIINFYIRYLQKPKSPTTKRCEHHFFNTYFYKKLKQDVLTKIDKETSFVKFRRWWKGVNIFEKTYIFLPIHEDVHWSLVIICIPDKEDESGPIILHLDSLGMHASNTIFNDVKSFLREEWKFLRQGDPLPELPIPEKIWKNLSRRIDQKVIEVPQQKNEYDCGLFVLFFMERFIDDAPERLKRKDLAMFGKQWFKPEQASNLRRKIKDLLKQEFKNANEGCV